MKRPEFPRYRYEFYRDGKLLFSTNRQMKSKFLKQSIKGLIVIRQDLRNNKQHELPANVKKQTVCIY